MPIEYEATEKYGPRIRFELEPWSPGYSPSVSLYDDGSMKICCQGSVIRLLVKEWHKLASKALFDVGIEEKRND